MKKWLASLPLWVAFLWINPVLANEAAPLAEDPVVEQRLIVIAEELRCLVCQNESLAGSRADLAMDLRREVRTLIKSGKSDAEIKKFLVDRYGDFILYNPPVKPTTWLLWFGPLALLLLAIGVLLNVVRRNQQQSDSPVLDAQQRARAQALLHETDSKK
jgi:cytochrome c-type biogenesis protein CcmH